MPGPEMLIICVSNSFARLTSITVVIGDFEIMDDDHRSSCAGQHIFIGGESLAVFRSSRTRGAESARGIEMSRHLIRTALLSRCASGSGTGECVHATVFAHSHDLWARFIACDQEGRWALGFETEALDTHVTPEDLQKLSPGGTAAGRQLGLQRPSSVARSRLIP
jgi:hypothetical protein